MDPALLPVLSVAAGVLSFSSPCCVPLVPGYLSFISALPTTDLNRREARAATLRAALFFVAGFSVVFAFVGASTAFLGSLVLRNLPQILRFAGVLIIVMGLGMLGLLRVPLLSREYRPALARVSADGRGTGAFPLGMAFAAGWVPCLGPVLASILAFAAASETAVLGAFLLLLYSLGLGIPFVLLALGFQRARRSTDWLRRHGRHVEIVGGLLLIGVGVLFVTGMWRELFLPLQRSFARWGWPPI